MAQITSIELFLDTFDKACQRAFYGWFFNIYSRLRLVEEDKVKLSKVLRCIRDHSSLKSLTNKND